jgi:putative cell wall-binding protein
MYVAVHLNAGRYAPRAMRRSRTLLVVMLALSAAVAAACGGRDDSLRQDGTRPTIGADAEQPDAAGNLGFPAFATKNTTRIGGADAVANAAAVASAVYPATSPRNRPPVVALVDARDWRAGIAAAVLAAPPFRAPILLSNGQDLPVASRDALEALRPLGAEPAGGAQVIRIGDVPAPAGLRATAVTGRDPFALAQAIDGFTGAARGKSSERVVIASADDPGYAMPAAAWAAKSGDPILFVNRDAVPAATRAALESRRKPSIYVVGPPETISERVEKALGRLGTVRRIGSGDAVRSSIDFARYLDDDFGWGVVDPGHGLVFARADRPLDAAAAAPLSASGTYGPLILLSNADRLDDPTEDYLLDIQPGYRTDPVRGVYNHGWIVGDDKSISVGVQARIDSLLEITRENRRAPSGSRS